MRAEHWTTICSWLFRALWDCEHHHTNKFGYTITSAMRSSHFTHQATTNVSNCGSITYVGFVWLYTLNFGTHRGYPWDKVQQDEAHLQTRVSQLVHAPRVAEKEEFGRLHCRTTRVAVGFRLSVPCRWPTFSSYSSEGRIYQRRIFFSLTALWRKIFISEGFFSYRSVTEIWFLGLISISP